MSLPRPPRYDLRRRADLEAELLRRARMWLPGWPAGANDPGAAVLKIAARLESEVTQRLDRIPEKSFRGFLHWLGRRGLPGRAARIPLAFRLPRNAPPVLAEAPIVVQADATGTPVTFETDKPLQVLPAELGAVIAADPSRDRFYGPFAGLTPWEAPKPTPDTWRLLVPISNGATELQLDPPVGLVSGETWIADAAGNRYLVKSAKDGLVGIDPPFGTPETAQAVGAATSDPNVVTRVGVFDPFNAAERNRQEHALYIGSTDGLDIKTQALVEIIGVEAIVNCTWEYWGKEGDAPELQWVPLAPADEITVGTFLKKPAGSIEPLEIGGKQSRWLRARPDEKSSDRAIELRDIGFKLNCPPPGTDEEGTLKGYLEPAAALMGIEGIANTTLLVVDQPFYPLGREPRLFDAFYLGSEQAFSKIDAVVTIDVTTGESFAGPIVSVSFSANWNSTYIIGIGGDGRLHLVILTDSAADKLVGTPDFRPVTQPRDARGLVSLNGAYRPGALRTDNAILVSAVGGNSIWVWSSFETENDGWFPIPSPTGAGEPTDTVLMRTAIAGEVAIYALFGGVLYRGVVSRANPGWTAHEVQNAPVKLQRLAPVLTTGAHPGELYEADGVVGVTEGGNLALSGDNWADLRFTNNTDPGTYPLALTDGTDTTIFAGVLKTDTTGEVTGPFAIAVDPSAPDNQREKPAMVGNQQLLVVGRSFGVVSGQSKPTAVFFSRGADPSVLYTTWQAIDNMLRRGRAVAAGTDTVGAPVGHARRYVSPGPSGALAISTLASEDSIVVERIEHAAILAAMQGFGGNNDLLMEFPSNTNSQRALFTTSAVGLDNGDTAFVLPRALPGSETSREAIVYEGQVTRAGAWDRNTKLLTLPGDTIAMAGRKIHVAWGSSDNKKVEVAQVVDAAARTVELVDNLPNSADGAVRYAHYGSYKKPDPAAGTEGILTLPGNTTAVAGASIYVNWGSNWRIVQIAQVLNPSVKTVTLNEDLPATADGDVWYANLTSRNPAVGTHDVAVRSALTLRSTPNGTLAGARLKIGTRTYVIESQAQAQSLAVIGISIPSNAGPINATLTWLNGEETIYQPPRPRNPELSWEYWDGQSWWQLQGVADGTENFVHGGKITFKVPNNLAASDVSGRTNHWVRARLVGGDYGQESVTLITSPAPATPDIPAGSTVQTVKRDPGNITAPFLTSIAVSYRLFDKVLPNHVVTQDSGGFRDQTDANTSPNATVRAFTPLKHSLPRTGATGPKPGGDKSECGCPKAPEPPPPPTNDEDCLCGDAPAQSADSAIDPNAETDRAIYLGFGSDQALQGDSVGLLFLVEDAEHDEAFPLRVEAYANDRFSPITANDDTRGLSQSGILTLSLPEPLQVVGFFGRALQWIRLKPRAEFDPAKWAPKIKSVHLNAAFAEAAETQRLEVLGSSDGSPGQKVSVARPPVLADSLELRVREPLGDEDINLLSEADPTNIKDKVGPWNGPWVRWHAGRLATSDATARVFELDAGTGEVNFGDGRHGAIPPIGQNTIVAVTYQRGGGPEANRVPAWGQVSLVTPLAGVEATIIPEGAAGGAGEQSPAEVVRFAPANLRMRERALTLADVETLALQSSPAIAQIRALKSRSGVRVVQVMRGYKPKPTNAARRELRRALLEAMPPEFSVDGAIEVVPPMLIEGTITLQLIVSALAFGGSVAAEATRRVRELLDPATGGTDGMGWPLGVAPDEADIAERLTGIKELVDIDDVVVSPKHALRPHELFDVAGDAIEVIVDVDKEVAA